MKKYRKSVLFKINKLLKDYKNVIVYKNPNYIKKQTDRYIVEEYKEPILNSSIYFYTGGIAYINKTSFIYGYQDIWKQKNLVLNIEGHKLNIFGFDVNRIQKETKEIKSLQNFSKDKFLIKLKNIKAEYLKNILVNYTKNNNNLVLLKELNKIL